MKMTILRGGLAVIAMATMTGWPGSSTAQDFYKGKTIRLIVATTPGGGFDAYSRMLARHMGKHIPGHPTFTVENMPGASFLIGTNYLYLQAKPDGLTLGTGLARWCCIRSWAERASSSTRASSNTSARRSRTTTPVL